MNGTESFYFVHFETKFVFFVQVYLLRPPRVCFLAFLSAVFVVVAEGSKPGFAGFVGAFGALSVLLPC